MDFSQILPVLLKGLGAAQVIANSGGSVGPAYRAIRVLLKKAEAGTVTQAELDETSTDLDGLMDRFNRPI
jgi:hypothetical protein